MLNYSKTYQKSPEMPLFCSGVYKMSNMIFFLPIYRVFILAKSARTMGIYYSTFLPFYKHGISELPFDKEHQGGIVNL